MQPSPLISEHFLTLKISLYPIAVTPFLQFLILATTNLFSVPRDLPVLEISPQCNYIVCLECGRPRFNPWLRKIPWRRKWQPTPGLLPGESHGGRSVVGYSPWGRKEWDSTKRLHLHSKEQEVIDQINIKP